MRSSLSRCRARLFAIALMARRTRCTVLAAALVLSAAPLAATTADDLCAPTSDPCLVTTAVAATPGSIIDVGDRELQLAASGSIAVQSDSLTLRGRRVVTGPLTLLRTSGRTRADAAAALEIAGDEVVLAGQIDVRGSPAGDVDVTATTTLTFSGTLRGRSEAADASASTVTLTGSTVLIGGSIDLAGGRDDFGGDLGVAGDRVTLTGSIVASGGDGGSVDISATELLLVDATASISANATTAAGDGGDISLASDDLLEIRGDLAANGRAGGDEGGGDGGQITLGGDASVVVPNSTAVVESLGGSPDGLAGDIEITSLFGSVQVNGTVLANSPEREGVGGSIDVGAETSITIGGTLGAVGALGGAGDVEIDSGTFTTITQGARIEANAAREGSAGSVSVVGGTFIDLRGTVLAETTQDSPPGGTVRLDACAVTMTASAIVRSRGQQAANVITAAGAMTVRGTLAAGAAQGSNTLRYPDEGPTPDTTGASIAPPPIFAASQEVIPCEPLPPTPTPSFTPTPSPSPTPTATVPPPACPGDCDDSGAVSIGELIRAVNIALGSTDVASCRAADDNGDGRVAIAELIRAVGAALRGCAA